VTTVGSLYGDTGSAARFFPALGFGEDELRFHYSAKASKAERAGSKHPTVKPLALMRWLCRLVTPPGGLVLDCFAGTGVTGEAALLEGFGAVLIEREAEYFADCRRRLGRLRHSPLRRPGHRRMSNDTTTLKLGTAELAVAKRLAAAVETIAGLTT
jgi:hypothetical protein